MGNGQKPERAWQRDISHIESSYAEYGCIKATEGIQTIIIIFHLNLLK